MKSKILIMRPDEPHETRRVELVASRYEDIRAIVEPLVGGLLEHVNVFADFTGGTDYRYMDMFVNETGVLEGMPVNAAATDIYRRNWMMHARDPGDPDDLPWIAGPAVLFEKKVWR